MNRPTTVADQDASGSDPLTDTDHKALAFLTRTNSHLRACLCTLARHGVYLRDREPDRAQSLLTVLAPWPLFKAGQFLFDLMEWEDFMIDGDPPPLTPTDRILAQVGLPLRWMASSATATAPGLVRALPVQNTAAALDLPIRWFAATARAALEGAADDLTRLLPRPAPAPASEADLRGEAKDLPPLEAGFYLYRDVVLGALVVLGPLLAGHAPRSEQPSAG
ncbi:hypothetical protein ACFC1R_23850 [Kitasatospora sp. NPDC056138]|uniref:hypothetical protein n=1 Tax=Kitasatospora sp. NPDC056138 TaxID=3345724 RepID=UPI0035E1931F